MTVKGKMLEHTSGGVGLIENAGSRSKNGSLKVGERAWDSPPAAFRYILFERVDPARNEARFYYLALQPTLFHPLAVVRIYGRIGETQHFVHPQPFDSLTEAWPLLKLVIRTRLRHGYRIVQEAVTPSALPAA